MKTPQEWWEAIKDEYDSVVLTDIRKAFVHLLPAIRAEQRQACAQTFKERPFPYGMGGLELTAIFKEWWDTTTNAILAAGVTPRFVPGQLVRHRTMGTLAWWGSPQCHESEWESVKARIDAEGRIIVEEAPDGK